MIARVWRGRAATVHAADSYSAHLRDTVLPGLEAIAGFLGVYLLRRETSGGIELEVVTLWESLAAIQSFAGDSLEQAVVEPQVRALLHEFDDRVRHFDIPFHQIV